MKRLNEAWFEFKGIRSDAMGIMLRSMPTRSVPGRNYKRQNVSGRDGTILQGDGTYKDATVKLECDVHDESRMSEILAWLSGEGQLVFSDEPNMAYVASVEKEISRSSIIPRFTAQRFTVTWTCEPFRLMIPPADPIIITKSGTVINNPGTVYAMPAVKIAGSGNFMVTIGMETMFFTEIVGGVIVDSALMDAFTYDGALTCNDNVSGSPYRIRPGANAVSWIAEDGAAISSIEITPRWRCI